jgi:hypothetical protein
MSLSQAWHAIQKSKTIIILHVLRTNDLTTSKSIESKTDDSKVKSLINKYKHVFWIELSSELSFNQDSDHHIDTENAKSIKINAYSLSQMHLKEQKRQIELLLAKELIQSFSNAWEFSIIFVKKSNDAWRMCVDYQALNKLIEKNEYSLFQIQKMMNMIEQTKYLSKFDLLSSY